LIIAPWPQPRTQEDWETEKVAAFNLVQEIIRSIRNIRSEKGVKPGRKIPAILVSESAAPILREQSPTIAALATLAPDRLEIQETHTHKPEGHIALVVGAVEIFLPLAGMVDAEEERARLQKELLDVQTQIERLEALLAGSFSEKAPVKVVQNEREKLAIYLETAQKLRSQLAALE
jgi:valyl-tRNA synthetase